MVTKAGTGDTLPKAHIMLVARSGARRRFIGAKKATPRSSSTRARRGCSIARTSCACARCRAATIRRSRRLRRRTPSSRAFSSH